MQKKNKKGVRRLWAALHYSIDGLKSAYQSEEAFRQEVFLLFILMPIGLWLGQTGLERAVLIGVLILILVVELLNSAVESIVDRIGLEHHVLCKRAKDMASAAVLLALVNGIVCWLLIICFDFY